MTTTDLERLFAQSLTVPAGLVWLADQLLLAAQHTDVLAVELSPAGALTVSGGQTDAALEKRYHRLVRPLLARIAKVAADESGGEFKPYDGRYTLRRDGDAGPVQLTVHVRNTPDQQRLTVERHILPTRPIPESDLTSAVR